MLTDAAGGGKVGYLQKFPGIFSEPRWRDAGLRICILCPALASIEKR
jgi:hypothetical protein